MEENRNDIKNPVKVYWRGHGPYTVDRNLLAKELKRYQEDMKRIFCVRCGQATGSFHPNEDLSPDLLATAHAILGR
jgi:hypothetical protein